MSVLRSTTDRDSRIDRIIRSFIRWTCMTVNGDDLGGGGNSDSTDSQVVFYNDLPLKRILKERRREIVDDLQEDVIEDLKINILSNTEYEAIMKQVTVEEKAEKLLDILDTKSSQEVAQFVNSLKQWYSWLYDLFNPLPQDVTSSALVQPVAHACDLWEERLTIGGVPPAPLYNVVRKKLLKKIRDGLREMKGNSFLVLYGMPGIGKSSLAAEALRDPSIVMDVFEGNVIWLTVGGSEAFEGSELNVDTMALLHNLNYRLGDERIEGDFDTHPELALVQLKNKYLSSSKKKCLIVLDEVQDTKVIEQLNVGVRYLITTSDLNIISKNISSVTNRIEIDHAFDEEESLELFAKCLKVSKSELFQKEAKLIHSQYRGFPLHMSLIGSNLAQHKEDALSKKERWNSYLPQGKGRSNNRYSGENDQAIRRLVDSSLETTLKPYFKYFALFMEDVNLKPEVLSVVWGVDKAKVEDIMLQFMNKSLVQRVWNLEQQSYVYGVHELILEYLKNSLSQQELEDLHKALVQNYMQKAQGNPSQLPKDDNYILYFIGYHLKMAGLFDMFQLFYYDLAFLEAKIKLADPYDLLRDLNKYKKYIIKENDSDEEFSSVYEFVENCKHWVLKGIDIAQLALQESDSRPFIYKKGVELAKKRFQAGQSYVKFPLGSVQAECTRKVVKLRNEGQVTTIDFVNSTDHVLIGFDSGEITFHDLWKNVIQTRCVGHTSAVTHLSVSKDGSYFVSTSLDGRVLKWLLTNVKRGNDYSPPPSEIQQNYEAMFTTPRLCGDTEPSEELAKFKNPCKWVCLHETADGHQYMAVLTERQYTNLTTIHVFHNGSNIYSRQISGLHRCEFFPTSDGKLAAAGDGGLWIVSENTQNLFVNERVTGLHICPENVIIVGPTFINVYKSLEHSNSVPLQSSSPDQYKCSHYNSTYLVVGTKTNAVVILDKNTKKVIHRYGGEQKAPLIQVKTWGNAVLAVYEDKTIDTYIVTETTTPCALNWPASSPHPLLVRCDRADRVGAYRGTDAIFHWDHIMVVEAVSKQSKKLAFAFCDCRLRSWLAKYEEGRTRTIEIPFELTAIPFKLLCHSIGDSSNHVVVACCTNGPLKVWHERNSDVKYDTGKAATQVLQLSSGCITADFDPYDDLIVITRSEIQIWSLTEGSFELRELVEASMDKAGLLASKSYLVHMRTQNTQLIQIAGGELIRKALLSIESVEDSCFSPDSNQMVLLSHLAIVVYDIEKRKYKTHGWPNGARWRSAAVSNTGVVCVIMTDGQVILFCPEEGKKIGRACLSSSAVVASPTEADLFAVTDRTGNLLYLELQKNPFDDC